MSVTREEFEPPEYDEPEEHAEGAAPDAFAELDDETRNAVEGEISRRAGVQRAQIRANLQAQGLDVTDDDQPVLRDPSRVSGWLGRPEPQREAPQRDLGAAPPPEEDEQIPDPVMDPVGFKKWHVGQVTLATKGLTDAIQYERAMRVASDIEIAVGNVAGAVDQFAPRFKDVLKHPGFDKAIREALSQVDPEMTKDRANLAKVVAMLSVDLEAQAPERPRDPAGRFSDARDAGRSSVSRQTLSQTAPSRDAGRQTKGREVTDVHRAVAERLSQLQGRPVSPEEIALLEEDSTGGSSREMRKKRLSEIKGRGR